MYSTSLEIRKSHYDLPLAGYVDLGSKVDLSLVSG